MTWGFAIAVVIFITVLVLILMKVVEADVKRSTEHLWKEK